MDIFKRDQGKEIHPFGNNVTIDLGGAPLLQALFLLRQTEGKVLIVDPQSNIVRKALLPLLDRKKYSDIPNALASLGRYDEIPVQYAETVSRVYQEYWESSSSPLSRIIFQDMTFEELADRYKLPFCQHIVCNYPHPMTMPADSVITTSLQSLSQGGTFRMVVDQEHYWFGAKTLVRELTDQGRISSWDTRPKNTGHIESLHDLILPQVDYPRFWLSFAK